MKTGRYSLKDLLTHNEIEQIIIPEIQRDYVWGEDNVLKLLSSIQKSFDKKEKQTIKLFVNDVEEKNETVTSYLKQEFERLKYNLKIGFIYAYHDRDYAGKFFLIDGQQRITTLFITLLYLYKETLKQEEFKSLYYKNGLLKLDYKVREQSHDFMRLFVDCELEGSDVEESLKYYSSEYNKDITIKNLSSNYKTIKRNLSSLSFDSKLELLNYIENFVELNYFDTHLSEQGEQLYIYMNSRGEQLSHQEIIRAELIQKEDHDSKKELGKTWEKWQNYFWNKKGIKNENADIGFEEFLKWATIIHICLEESPNIAVKSINGKKQTITEAKENYIRRYELNRNEDEDRLYKEQKEYLFKYQTEQLNFTFLTEIFNALEILYSIQSKYIPTDNKWLCNDIKAIDYVTLLPLIVYIKQNTWEIDLDRKKDIKRIAMFLKNITYFESVSKNPDTYVIYAIEIINKLCDDKKDIINLLDIEGFKTVLTDNEKEKLKRCNELESNRRHLEEFIWDISLNKKLSDFLMGDISILFNCHDLKLEEIESDSKFEINELNNFKKIFKNLIFDNKDSDKLRRLMLCFFDFSDESGNSTSGLCKYSFINVTGDIWGIRKEWKQLFSNDLFIDMLLEIEYLDIDNIDELFEIKKNEYTEKDWKEAFIKDGNLLKYCTNKKILWENEDRFLLLSQINYSIAGSREVQCELLRTKFQEEEMWIHQNNCCVIDIIIDKSSTINFKKSSNDFALDFVFNHEEMEWFFTLLHREKKIINLFDLTNFNDWEVIEDRLTVGNSSLYKYNSDKSLIENNQEIEKIIRDLLTHKIIPLLNSIDVKLIHK